MNVKELAKEQLRDPVQTLSSFPSGAEYKGSKYYPFY